MKGDPIFTLSARDPDSRARTGTISLPHGRVKTPVFMPVGTAATVKAIGPDSLSDIGFEIILANTYHLFLRPGHELIRESGGLHGFSGWRGNFLTDSGGFQVFSLTPFRKILDEGVSFRSHIDGSSHFFTPDDVVAIQCAFNSDIQMQLDVCTSWGVGKAEAKRALDLTSDWAKRAKNRWNREAEEGYRGLLFGIIQGNFYNDLRKQSAEEIVALDLPGIAIGGLSVGEPFEVFAEHLENVAAFLPPEKPHYLMGIGTPDFIFEAVENGIDMFDCVFPTRTARNGLLFTSRGPLSIKKPLYERDWNPIDRNCGCTVCRNHSRAYLRHLFKSQEILFSMLATYHNLFFLHDLVRKIASSIEMGNFSAFKREFLGEYALANP